MAIRTDRIVLFVEVIELGSFSAVARRLGVQVSSVSRQIASLEDELGVRLLDRTPRSLRLTEAGETFLEHALQIAASLEEARRSVTALGTEPTGLLRISAPATMAGVIAPLIPEFLARHGGIRIGLSLSDRVVDLVQEGVDVAIRFGTITNQSLIARRVATSTSLVCASPAYLERRSTPTKPSELTSHDCLSFRSRPGMNAWRFRGPGGAEEVRVSGPFYSDSGLALLDAAIRGLGLIILPLWLLAPAISSGALVPVLSEYELVPASTPIHAVFQDRRHVAPKVRAFVEFLAEKWSDGWTTNGSSTTDG